MVGVVLWLLATQRQEKSPLTINNYLLKHNGITIIYAIYLWKLCRFLLYLRNRQIWYLLGATFHSFLGEWGFCWRGFGSWRDLFSYSPVFGIDIGYLLSSNPKNICFYTVPDWQTNRRSFRNLLLLIDKSVNQMR